ncbi:hypothetical protein FACS1894111_08030 [Clostridia bacterium]|nr:hypothetical protein FACS1894111_08030 [Clostridia bacterium]
MVLYDPKNYIGEFVSDIHGESESYALAYAELISSAYGMPCTAGKISEYLHGSIFSENKKSSATTISPYVMLSSIKKSISENKALIVLHSHPPYGTYPIRARKKTGRIKGARFSEQDWRFIKSVVEVYGKLTKSILIVPCPICFAVFDKESYQAVSWNNGSYADFTFPDASQIWNPHFLKEVN